MKSLTVTDLEQSGPIGAIWVRNTCSQNYSFTGDILLSIPGNAGQQAQALKVPSTWLPINLTEQFPKHRILESTDFRNAVRHSLLTVISDETANRLLNDPTAADEQRRLRADAQKRKNAGAARIINPENVEIRRTDGIKDEDEDPVDVYGGDEDISVAKAALHGLDLDDNGLSPSFIMFAGKASTLPDVSALNSLKTRGRFTRGELKYLRDNLKNHPQTVVAVKERLTAMANKKKVKKAA